MAELKVQKGATFWQAQWEILQKPLELVKNQMTAMWLISKLWQGAT